VSSQLHAPGRFTPSDRDLGTHCVGGWVGPRARMDGVENRKFLTLPGLELRQLGRPARSQSLYRLRYPGSSRNIIFVLILMLHRHKILYLIHV
jgi:hypothetical protein